MRHDIFAGDVYEVTNPWIGSTCDVAGGQSDCLWGYGTQTQNYVANDTGGKPVWVDIETGTNDLGDAETNGSTCNSTTNLCSKGNEQRATPEQVNSAAWLTLINGSNGIIWFCDDSLTGADACLGGGANGNPSACAPTCGIAANLTYVDANVEGFAQELNSPDAAGVTVASSNPAVPVDEMTKVVNGVTYLFTEADRGTGKTTATYTDAGLAGSTATLVYDSAARYDPSISEQGKTFALDGSGSFSDSLTGDTGNSANAVSYQVKIYAISDGAPAPTDSTTTNPSTTTTTTTIGGTTSTTSSTTSTSTTTTTTTIGAPADDPTPVSCDGNSTTSGSVFALSCRFDGDIGSSGHLRCWGSYQKTPNFQLYCKT